MKKFSRLVSKRVVLCLLVTAAQCCAYAKSKKERVRKLRVWLYYRLSRDEDEELNSLKNQRKIIAEYADEHEYEIVGESFDDNVSGMHFDRDGIEKIYDAADNRLMDAVIVKDLSRLGRHRTQTALFIDYLRTKDIRVLSVTENIDTMSEDDDLIIGFKGIMNDFYAKDMSRKIRAGYRQKQKDGLITIPPMGYFKDKNTGEIVIIEEAAEVVRQIYDWYIGGYGLKAIAKMLNERGIKSASYWQKLSINKNQPYNRPDITFKHLWESTAIKRILQNEFYIGTMVNHKSYTSRINKIRKDLPESEHFRHENFVPAIISKEIWEQAQFLLSDKPKRNVRAAPGKPFKRYVGLLKCGDCGCCFVAKNRYWRDNPVRVEYNCNGYHRYGKEHCTAHRIDESTIDKLIYDEFTLIKAQAEENWQSIESDVKKWAMQKSNAEKRISDLTTRIQSIDLEIEKILMERINDKENRTIYDNMLQKRREEISDFSAQIESIRNIDVTIQKRKTEIKQSIDLIDDIIESGGISGTHLRMLVEQIVISENERGLRIEIDIKAPFRTHFDVYDDNELLGRNFVSVLGY